MSVLSWSALLVVLVASASTWHSMGSTRAATSSSVSKSDVSKLDIALCFERARNEGLAGLARRLESLGQDAFSALFELGAVGELTLETDAGLKLENEEERLAVFEALSTYAPETLGNQLPQVGELLLEDSGRIFALEWLFEVGAAAQVEDALRVAAWRTEDDDLPADAQRVSRPVRKALGNFLLASFDTEEELTRSKLVDRFTTTPLALASTLVDALAEQRGRRNFVALADLLQNRPEVDPYLLVVLSKDAGEIVLPVPDRVLASVRGVFDAAKADDVRALSLRLLGRLEDEVSIPQFLAELVSENAVVSDAALDALRSCTGRKYGRNPRSWQAWIRQEERWWSERSADIFAEVCDGKGGAITRSIQAIAHRRLRRHELARQMECVLQREEKTLVVLGCATLGHIGSWNSLPPLIGLMKRSTEPEIVLACHKALMKITGYSPPMEATAWQLLLDRES